jgi:RNA-directed DNA polymerase
VGHVAIKLATVQTEKDLIETYDKLYAKSKQYYEEEKRPIFRDLLEVIISEPNIRRAIKRVKGNKGTRTVGVDGTEIHEYLEKAEDELFDEIRHILVDYKANKVRRKHIDKRGGGKRPLGIPTIMDRIIQEMVRAVLEPIFEGQFFKHSYGFRPDRNAGMAKERIQYISFKTGYNWAVEGDIKGFFDNVDHTKLIKIMWNRGIRDKRVLMIVKEMLKAGVMNETTVNELGTPQGGIISPLLANVYLDTFDRWMDKQWESKKVQGVYGKRGSITRALNRSSKLKPAYLIRYADDWVILTNNKENAIFWKQKANEWFAKTLKLELSLEKTKITNMRNKYIEFVGFEIKLVKSGKGFKGYLTRSLPNRKRLKEKIKDLLKYIDYIIRIGKTREDTINAINRINSKIRGLVEYYQCANQVSLILFKHASRVRWRAYRSLVNKLGKGNVKVIPAKETHNLSAVHGNYDMKITTVEYEGYNFGVTDLAFANWKKVRLKNPKETKYSEEGRKLLEKRGKKSIKVRADELLSLSQSERAALGLGNNKLYNFEYFLNRAYAFNRDKGKCRVCGGEIKDKYNINTHHINPKLSLHEVNKTANLSSMHTKCHKDLHSVKPLSEFNPKVAEKIDKFREKLNKTS